MLTKPQVTASPSAAKLTVQLPSLSVGAAWDIRAMRGGVDRARRRERRSEEADQAVPQWDVRPLPKKSLRPLQKTFIPLSGPRLRTARPAGRLGAAPQAD